MSDVNKIMNGWVFVRNVADEKEAVMVESILETEGIPVQRKYKEAGDYLEIYMGTSRYGIDLFVPEDTLELAKGLLESEVTDMPEEADTEENKRAAEKYEEKRKGIVWIILMYIFIPVILAVIWNLLFNK